MGKISVVLSVVDQEIEFLPHALSSVREISSEIVIVDMTSSDALFEIANKYRAKVYKHTLVPYVEIVRNFGISKAKEDWVLVMDPDEEVSGDLANKLKSLIEKDGADYYRLPRKNIIFGKWIKHSRWWPDYNIRFFKRGAVNWNENIHSVPVTKGEGADLDAKEEYAIVHHHYQSIEQYITRMNRYTSAQAENLVKEGHAFNWHDLIKKPSEEFLGRFFQAEGFKDGVHGFALAGLQAVSEFVIYLKVWQAGKFKDSRFDLKSSVSLMKETEKDLHYWQADALYKDSGDFGQRIKRKFKLS